MYGNPFKISSEDHRQLVAWQGFKPNVLSLTNFENFLLKFQAFMSSVGKQWIAN